MVFTIWQLFWMIIDYIIYTLQVFTEGHSNCRITWYEAVARSCQQRIVYWLVNNMHISVMQTKDSWKFHARLPFSFLLSKNFDNLYFNLTIWLLRKPLSKTVNTNSNCYGEHVPGCLMEWVGMLQQFVFYYGMQQVQCGCAMVSVFFLCGTWPKGGGEEKGGESQPMGCWQHKKYTKATMSCINV